MMFLIVAHHFSLHSGFKFATETVSLNRLWIQLIQLGGKIGVNVFVLISGYFLVTSKHLRPEKILKLWIQIFFYSFIIVALFLIAGKESFSAKSFIKNFFPITFNQYWFASAYFVLFLLYPYINILLTTLKKSEYRKMLILLCVMWSVFPTFTKSQWQSNNLLWFVFLYSTAGYIRLHVAPESINSSKCIFYTLLLASLTFLSSVIFDVAGTRYASLAKYATHFYSMNKLPIFIISITVFLYFLKLKIKHSPFINHLAATAFGIYLIHDNSLCREYIWLELFKCNTFAESNWLIPYSVVVSVSVFAICSFLEALRIKFLEHNCLKVASLLYQRTRSIFNGLHKRCK